MVTRRRAILILRRTVDVLIVGLVALVLLALFLGRVVPLTGRETLIIAGGSMEPTLPIGSAVVIEPVPAGRSRGRRHRDPEESDPSHPSSPTGSSDC